MFDDGFDFNGNGELDIEELYVEMKIVNEDDCYNEDITDDGQSYKNEEKLIEYEDADISTNVIEPNSFLCNNNIAVLSADITVPLKTFALKG